MKDVRSLDSFVGKILIAVLVGMTPSRVAEPVSDVGAAADASFAFKGVRFKEGRPVAGEALVDALESPSAEHVRALEQDARELKSTPGFRVEVVGFTDNRECVGRDCYDLSLRRAQLVYDWLVASGVPKKCLSGPQGYGGKRWINDNSSEDGRQQNRRAEVNAVGFEKE